MKNRLLLMINMAAVLLSILFGNLSVQAAKTFLDVPSNTWFYSYVIAVAEAGYISGYTDGRFGPEDHMTRGQFSAILYRIEGCEDVIYKNTFPDVKKEAFYAQSAEWTNQQGLITGYENGDFGPEDYLTREQLATILYRYATWKSISTEVDGDINRFLDANKISDFSKEALKWAVGEKIISGNADGTLEPQGIVTRAVAATMISHFVDEFNDSDIEENTKEYNITLICDENGSAVVDKESAAYGEVVNVLVYPNEGYVETVRIQSEVDESISYLYQHNMSTNKYSFVMAEENVVIRIELRKGYKDINQWTFDDDGELTRRNKTLRGLTYCNGSTYPVVAPDDGINWDNDIIYKHIWYSKNTDVTTYNSFFPWDGDLNGEAAPENDMVTYAWLYNSQGLSFQHWVNTYLEVRFYYDLRDSYAIESHERLGINSSFLIEHEISEEAVTTRQLEYVSSYPHVVLSDVTVPPVEGAVLLRVFDDGYVEEYNNEFIVSYNIYGGTGQWANFIGSNKPDLNGNMHDCTSRLLWGSKM